MKAMFKTKEEALRKLEEVTPDNYFSVSASRHDPLGGVWSKSALKSLACNTLDWFAGTPFRGSAKTEFGNLVDCMATEPEKFHSTYFVSAETDKRKKAFLDDKKVAESLGRTPITTKDVQRSESALAALQGNEFGRVLLGGQMQRILKGTVKLCGPLGDVWVPLKAKTDSVTEHADGSLTIEDLKTTESPDPTSIKSVSRYLSYHWQDAIYTVLAKQMGHEVRDFRFVFVGTDEPYHVQPVKFSQEAREWGLKGIERALGLVYWAGFGYGVSKFYPTELTLGEDPEGGYKPKNYWDTCPDFNLGEVEVVWP